MNKREFLSCLRTEIAGLPQNEIEDRLAFYSEMIDDRMEEGFSEEEAVNAVGSIDSIVSQLVTDIPFSKLMKEKLKAKRRMTTWKIVLLALGFPLWFPLLIAVLAVVFSFYVSLCSVIISLWAVFVSIAVCALYGLIIGLGSALSGHTLKGTAMIALSIVCIGFSIFLFFGCKAATKGTFLLTKMIVLGIKKSIIKKEGEQ